MCGRLLTALTATALFCVVHGAVWPLATPLSYLAQFNSCHSLLITVGGYNGTSATSTVEIYSLSNESHRHVHSKPLPEALYAFASALYNNTVYILTGRAYDRHFSDAFWSYNIEQNEWNATLPAVPTQTFGSAAVELDGQIYLLGGITSNDTFESRVFVFDTKIGEWFMVLGAIPQTSYYPCAVVINQHLYYMPAGNLYVSANGASAWQKLSSPSVDRDAAVCAQIGEDAILLAGGNDGNVSSSLSSAEIYNITTNKWQTVAPMQFGRGEASAARLPNSNAVIVCGGYVQSKGPDKSCEVYDWAKNEWSMAEFSLKETRFYFSLFATEVKTNLNPNT